MLDSQLISTLKAGLAVAGTLLLLLDWWLRRTGRTVPGARWRRDLLAVLGILAVLGWWDFRSPLGPRLHRHEFFHYFLGAKYQAELGYTRLYQCVALAEAQTADAALVRARWIRNLETNVIEPGHVALADAEAVCPARFTPDRWQAFLHDATWFREQVEPDRWRALFVDHGYNATPVWTMAGTALTNLGVASSSFTRALARLDVVLLLGLWGVVWWGFGWQTACVAALWWGTNHPARAYWTGGALLRADWLLLVVVAIASLRRGFPALSGAALGYAALLRIFPGALALGYVLVEGWRMWQTRTWRPSKPFVHFTLGMALSVAVLVPAASWVNGQRLLDLEAWQSFAQNSQKHLSQTSTNRMGLKVLVAFDPATRVSQVRELWQDSPWDAWYEARARTFERRQPIFWGLVAAYLVLLAFACRGQDPWIALVLASGLLVMAFELSSYYYAFFLIVGLLWSRHAWAGPLLVGASALGWGGAAALDTTDEVFLVHSVLVAVVAFVLPVALLARRHSAAEASSPAALDSVESS